MHGDLPIEYGTQEAAESYRRRLEATSHEVLRLQRTDRRFVRARTGLFLAAIVVGTWWMGDRSASVPFAVIAGALFITILAHRPVVARIRRAVCVQRWYSSCLQRLTGRWKELPVTGEAFIDRDHPWSSDLDLFGPASLFQKLNQCRTLPARRMLARWLTEVPAGDDIRRRQEQAESVRHELDLRERLAVIDDASNEEATEATLNGWAVEEATPVPGGIVVGSTLLGLMGTVTVVPVVIGLCPPSILLLIVILQMVLMFLARDQIQSVSRAVDDVDTGLRQFSRIASELESHPFADAGVRRLQAVLTADGQPASRQIHILSRRIAWLNHSLRNQFLVPFAWLFGLVVVLTHRIESWRQQHGTSVRSWIAATAELEVLLSVGAWSHDNGEFHLPSVSDDETLLTAENLGHPLLPSEECVCNDVRLTRERPLMLISGSNMSGKSTLLRSIGTNVVLAYCGARVHARDFTTSVFQLGTVMRVSDSLQEGRSLFFSVVQRLRQVVDLTGGPHPVLFLLDEILHGTNSNDRRRGAEAVIRTLLDQNGLGLVTTHDLELTRIVDSLDGRAANFHFEDQVEDGQMTFDYRLRNGVVERSNAIELMRMMGLEV